jgi:hypothetical protein
MTEKHSARGWLEQPKYRGINVLDPDGWDRTALIHSWAEEIDEAEFMRRLSVSTCSFPAGFFPSTSA